MQYIGVVLIPMDSLHHFKKFEINGILHIGAHEAEENSIYKAFTPESITWIEAQRDLALRLEKTVLKTDFVINAAIGEQEGEIVELKITNNSQSSSILSLGTHETDYPEIKVIKTEKVRISRIDRLYSDRKIPNFVNIDIQGAELQALKGFGDRLNDVDVIYIEVNSRPVYKGCAVVKDVDDYLQSYGFRRATTYWIIQKGWGDAVYIHERVSHNFFAYRLKLFPRKITGYSNQAFELIKSKITHLLFLRRQAEIRNL